jgi:SAM-dependent methyltransferase
LRLNIEWLTSDMRAFRRPGSFDAAVNLLTSFGYFDDPADERRVLDNVFASLTPGGVFAMDLMGKEVLTRIFRERDWHEEVDGTLVLEERRERDDWTWLDVRWILLRDGRRTEHRFSLRPYGVAELKSMLNQAGFSQVRAYGKPSGAPYDHEAERLIVVGVKPGPGRDAA